MRRNECVAWRLGICTSRTSAPSFRGGREALFERALDLRIEAFEEVRARHSDPDAADVTSERRQVVVDRNAARGRVGGVVTGHGLEEVRAILDRARHRAGVVERPRKREDARAAHAPVRGLEPDDAAEGGRPADGPAGVRARRAADEPRGQGGAGPAARAAWNVVEVPRIAGGREAMAGELDAERELVGDELAEKDGAGLPPAPDARRLVLRDPVGEKGGPARRPDAPRKVDVLVGDRDAEQCARRRRGPAPPRPLARRRGRGRPSA